MGFVLGLTGSIATGKSTVARMFADRGVPVWSADEAVHALYDGAAVKPVAARFPRALAGTSIDRIELARLIDGDPRALADLEAIVHPLVRRQALDFVAEAGKAGAELCVLEVPLLFETGAAYPLDAVAVTWCDPALQRARALERAGMSVEKFDALLARQLPQEDKKARADFLIDTGTTFAETAAGVADIIAACRARAGGKGQG